MKKRDFFYDHNYNHKFPSALHLACGNDDLRPMLECIHFINGYAYASDAHILIRQSFSFINIEGIEKLEGKSIHLSVFQRIYAERNWSVIKVTDDGNGIELHDQRFDQRIVYKLHTHDQKVPDYEAVIPKNFLKKEHLPSYCEIGVNQRILTTLFKAMAIAPETNNVHIILPDNNNRSILVMDLNSENAGPENQIGLIMPVMIGI